MNSVDDLKRTNIAIFICIAVIIVYSQLYLTPYQKVVVNEDKGSAVISTEGSSQPALASGTKP
ncbi:MAG: hypothetical protein KDD53_05305, partial [Bdellovibrionales bacterium]|nr:hypothetical protein [Bdellovibrionales bacterium]